MSVVDAELDSVDLSTAVPEAIVLSVSRPLVGARRNVYVDVPGRSGSWSWADEPGDRALSIDLSLAGEDFAERRDAVRRLADWADLGRVAPLIISDEADRYHEAMLDAATDPAELLLHASTRLDFRVGPYALSTTISTQAEAAASNPDSGMFSIPDEVTALPVIEITPTNGTLLSVALTIEGRTISWSGDVILLGQTLTISTVSDTVTRGVNADVNLTGAYDPAAVNMVDVSGDFPLLVPGSNDWAIEWTGTATAVDIDIQWRRRYR